MNEFHVGICIDPSKKYTAHTNEEIMQAAGILAVWATDQLHKDLSLREVFDMEYQFPIIDHFDLSDPLDPKYFGPGFEQAKIDNDGVFKFPRDPDVHPLLALRREFDDGAEVAYIYPNSYIGINQIDGHTSFICLD